MKTTLFISLAAFTLIAAGCNKQYVEIPETCRTNMTTQISAASWAKANNAFGFKLLRRTEGNTVFSPYSIERAIGMTLEGACGTTAEEMLNALEMPNAKRLGMSGMEVEKALTSINSNTILEIDNTIWLDNSYTLPNNYISRINAAYHNKAKTLNFVSDPESARMTINQDISKTTHNRINDLLPLGSISGETRIVLTNAVYFKSKWSDPFSKGATKPEVFYNSTGSVEIETMHKTEDDSSVCLANDYAVHEFSFNSSNNSNQGSYYLRIILPTIDESHPMENRMQYLAKVEQQLSPDSFIKDCHYEPFEVHVALPKFKLEPDTISITNHLWEFGMRMAFSDKAEFYEMINQTHQPNDKSDQVMISDIYHKAFIQIDEDGAEAAAATAVADQVEYMPEAKPKYEFKVDHPFLFQIVESSTGAILFMGRVTDL